MSSLRGFADFHSHPMAHLGFGGKVLAGAPYSDRGLADALANCEGVGRAHNPTSYAGALMGWFIRGMSEKHGPCGAPTFRDWPTHETLYHQQMYVDWLERAHRHGLRLLCALAVNTELLARKCGAVRYSDYNMIDSQVRELRRFVAWARKLSTDAGRAPWLDIAKSPAEARQIIGRGELALIVGVEVDTLESLARHEGNDEPTHLAEGPSLPTRSLWNKPLQTGELARVFECLEDFGVSMITPVHVADNSFGGAAIYDDSFDLLNEWLRREPYEEIIDSTVSFELGRRPLLGVMRKLAGLRERRPYVQVGAGQGHANSKGLTELGKVFLREAMKRGLIIDIDHMSARAIDDALSVAKELRYPVISSHSSFRELGLTRAEAPDGAGLRHESMKTPEQVDAILSLGGVVAPITNQHRCRSHGDTVANDCEGSSKTYAQAFLYAYDAIQKKGKGGLGFGTDFNGFAGQPGPRYASGGQPDSQRVRYDDPDSPAFFDGKPLGRSVLQGRARPFDLNVDGLAHFGMLPDFIEDLRKIHVPNGAIDLLFNSAEAFVGMWESCRTRSAELSVRPTG